MSEGYNIQRVQVGTTDWTSFTGRKLSQINGEVSIAAEDQRGRDFTLYETPQEGRKLHVQEWQIEGNIQKRDSRERAAKFERIEGALYSEEEARQKYPEAFEELLNRAHD